MDMSFEEAVAKAQKGLRVRRPSWDKDMWMGWDSEGVGFLVHTHPYTSEQQKLGVQNMYPYICENGDSSAHDWRLV